METIRRRSLAATAAVLALTLAHPGVAAPTDAGEGGVVFEVEVTFTRKAPNQIFPGGAVYLARMTAISRPDGEGFTRPGDVAGVRVGFKNSDGILNQIKEGMTATLRIDCDDLGDGSEVMAMVRIEEQRGWDEGVAAFRSIDSFKEICG